MPYWDRVTPEHVPTMIFCENTEQKVDYDDELMIYKDHNTERFEFSIKTPEEEGDGSDWVY